MNPASAPARPDLVFLTRRSRPRPAVPARPVDTRHHDVRHDPPPPVARLDTRHHDAAPPPASLDLSSPAPTASLDLSSPAPTASLDLSAPTPTASLDLSAPAPTASLDLSDAPAAPRPPARQARRVRTPRRLPIGQQLVLDRGTPTVTLSRFQSGIGVLTVTAACSPKVGDVVLGCAYALAGGRQSAVQVGGARLPWLVARHETYDRVLLDLRHVREVERLTVYALSASHQPLDWAGTLVVSGLGGTTVDVPLDVRPSPVAVLLSAYVVDGEVVLRRELRPYGSLRDALLAYGHDRTTWLDAWTPVS